MPNGQHSGLLYGDAARDSWAGSFNDGVVGFPEIAVSAPTRAMADGNLSLGCLASALVKNPSSPGSIPESMAVAVGTGLLAWAMSVAAAVFAR